jgi:hypothetical protein
MKLAEAQVEVVTKSMPKRAEVMEDLKSCPVVPLHSTHWLTAHFMPVLKQLNNSSFSCKLEKHNHGDKAVTFTLSLGPAHHSCYISYHVDVLLSQILGFHLFFLFKDFLLSFLPVTN